MRAALSLGLALALLASVALAAPRIIDGDTLQLSSGERVRIENIDAPELQARCEAERRLALAAKADLAQAVGDGSGLRVERSGVDRYGRTLAKLRRGGTDIGETMISRGLARRWTGRRFSWCG
jgi:micrococcal nuclease